MFMKSQLFIIGNGFDLAHNLPTRFSPDFKNIAMRHEPNCFWDFYQSNKDDIWSDFENLLGCPDFNSLEEIFQSYSPDYSSDRENDRDDILCQAKSSGNLQDSLREFVNNAEWALNNIQRQSFFENLLNSNGYYITFNYTHTLESIYHIPQQHILHIHGEAGKSHLDLGYPKGNFTPEEYCYDARGKGRDPYIETKIENYVNDIEDYYVRAAYEELVDKCKSFYKESRINLLKDFLYVNQCEIENIIVYGHSCAIDFEYFNYLNARYANANWTFYVLKEEQESSVLQLIKRYSIKGADIVVL